MNEVFLENSLNSLLKEDLFRILYYFNVKVAKNTTKDILIEKIKECYQKENTLFVKIFSKETIEYISKYRFKNFQLKEKDFIENEQLLLPFQTFGFLSKNIIKEKENNHYLVSEWFIKKIRSLNKSNTNIMEQYQELEMIILGLLNFYGIIEENVLTKICCGFFPQFSKEEIKDFFKRRWILSIFIGFYNKNTDNIGYYVSSALEEPATILAERLKYDYLHYRVLTYDKLKEYSIDFYIEKSDAIFELMQLFKKMKIPDFDIGLETINTVNKLKNNYSIDKIINDLEERIELKNKNLRLLATTLIANLKNLLPLWSLKGHTLNEIGTQPRIVEKIGRNDPCICGSNKKYKKCCGK